MTKPTVRIVNAETAQVTDREMTDAEFTAYEADQLAIAAAKAEEKVNAEAKAELLSKLGITADEAKLLIG